MQLPKTIKKQYIVTSNDRPLLFTLCYQRKGAIDNYLMGDKRGWDYWKNNYNLKVVKVDVTLTLPSE